MLTVSSHVSISGVICSHQFWSIVSFRKHACTVEGRVRLSRIFLTVGNHAEGEPGSRLVLSFKLVYVVQGRYGNL